MGEPSVRCAIAPGQRLEFGVTRYQVLKGGLGAVYLAFRAFLDESSCHWPQEYNPTVQWNELYDNQEWHVKMPAPRQGPQRTGRVTYTKALIM